MKKTSVLFLVSIVVTVSLIVPLYFQEFEALGETELKRFSSYEELKSFVTKSAQYYPYVTASQSWRGVPTVFALSSAEGTAKDSDLSFDYSNTNIQVEGVDEADFVKTDGQYIYIASGENITILKAYPPEEAAILSKISMNGTICGLFINGNKMVILEGGYSPYVYYATFATPVKSFPYYRSSGPAVKVYDISDRANPILTRNITLDGHYFDSRMIGDYVYAVINEQVYANESWVSLPRIYLDGEVKEMNATQIYYSNVSTTFNSFTTIIAINTQNDAQPPTNKTILMGATSNLYVSMNNIYITFEAYNGEVIPSSPVKILPLSESLWATTIYRVHVENGEIEIGPSGHVPGTVLNQFSMDEYNEHFRIATTTGEVWNWGQLASQNHIYVLDMNLNVVGRLENLAEGEKIHSARFMGNRCYLVTFKKIDPLFVIDLSNPSEPRVLGELEIPGYSDYLHPYDENHIIGVGKETVEGEGGNFAWYQGVKISLFDVSDVEHPQEIDKYVIGDRGTESPVLTDHKAFLFDKAKSLLVIPVSVVEIGAGNSPPWAYGQFVFQGAYVFNITLSEGLVLKGRITHLEDVQEPMNGGCYSYSSYYVERSLYIDNVLYTISHKKIKMNSLENLDELNEIELP